MLYIFLKFCTLFIFILVLIIAEKSVQVKDNLFENEIL